ncbi:hypothetical protein [uncultured Ramlibacter sp.]|uniref:hypothetical protein n=1 Tax=uncultured Ramlibacter sp. TaxID=260755 RepID=UPI002632677E|nr:hypothetical protein [uncultured Ramlibacter sp.]
MNATPLLTWLRWIVFPPADLFLPVFDIPTQVQRDHLSAEAVCLHKYATPYEVGVKCNVRMPNPISILGRLLLEVSWENATGDQLLCLTVEVELKKPWWDGTASNGFSLLIYTVPADLPVNMPLLCRLKLTDTEGALSSYQPCSFYARSIWMP